MKFKYDPIKEKLIVTESTRIETHQLKLHLTRKVKGYQFTQPYKMRVWNGDESYFDNGEINLGLWKECALACRTIETKFEIENKEDFPINREVTLESVDKFCKTFFKDHKVKTTDGIWVPFMPYDYQIETAYKILRNRFCLAEVATSGGKSLIISIVYFYTITHIQPDAKLLLVVPSITLVTQFYNDLLTNYWGQNNMDNVSDYKVEVELTNGTVLEYKPNDEVETKNRGIIKADELNDKDLLESNIKRVIEVKISNPLRIEEIMSDKPRVHKGSDKPNVYIGCYQSLAEFKDTKFFKQFHNIIVDEAHTCKAASLKKILKRTVGSAYSRIGLSGTLGDESSLEFLTIQYYTGPKVVQVEASDLMKLGTVAEVAVKVLVLNHNDKEFDERMKWVKKGGLGKEVHKFEKEYIQNSERRHAIIVKLVKTFKANGIVLFHNIDHGTRILKVLSEAIPEIDFHYIDGSIKNAKRQEIFKLMERTDGKIQIGIASYGVLSTGVSVRAITNVILLDSFKSEVIVLQSIGRALRLHAEKTIATIYDIVDVFDPITMNNILYKHFQEREKFYIRKKYPYKISKLNL